MGRSFLMRDKWSNSLFQHQTNSMPCDKGLNQTCKHTFETTTPSCLLASVKHHHKWRLTLKSIMFANLYFRRSFLSFDKQWIRVIQYFSQRNLQIQIKKVCKRNDHRSRNNSLIRQIIFLLKLIIYRGFFVSTSVRALVGHLVTWAKKPGYRPRELFGTWI